MGVDRNATRHLPQGAAASGASLRRGAPLVLAGAIGAGIALGIGAAAGLDGGTTTIVREVTAAGTASRRTRRSYRRQR